MSNCKQKTVELFLGFQRNDIYDGGNLINVYHGYVNAPSDAAFSLLLLHNADDIRGLIRIFPVLAYYDMFNKPLKAKKVQANTYTDYFGMERQELLLKVSLPAALPAPVRFHANSCYFNGEGVAQNWKEAVRWYRKAAERGNAYAQFNLGLSYYYGEGISKNLDEALKWFRKAAEQGHADAQKKLQELGYNY